MQKGIIFDMDGVLIDAMSFHAESMKLAINEVTNLNIDKKIVYLLAGLPGSKLVKEIFEREKIDREIDNTTAEKISKRKMRLFESRRQWICQARS
jgi:beta-phosphoglucomutase-like phosphatase (HAD superfamily)